MDITHIGLPKAKENQLRTKGIETIEDLVNFTPRTYRDCTTPGTIKSGEVGTAFAVAATLVEKHQGPKMAKAKMVDTAGTYFHAVWFGEAYHLKRFEPGERILVFGKLEWDTYSSGYRISVPPVFVKDNEANRKIYPVYSKVKGMAETYLMETMQKGLQLYHPQDVLEPEVRTRQRLLGAGKAAKTLHEPPSLQAIAEAERTRAFEDLFTYAIKMEERDRQVSRQSPFIPHDNDLATQVADSFPYDLTEGQREVLKAVYNKMKRGQRVEAMIQGDVGCGKTIVAVLLMTFLVGSGYQGAIMTPTQVLAGQHFLEVERLFEGTGRTVRFLHGNLKAGEKKKILKEIADGTADIVVGTHAVISDDVAFRSLAMTIVDEEHRFGVRQREKLRDKAKEGVHHVNMSATPIPRSLALAVYGGGIDIYTIKTMPGGRIPVRTVWFDGVDRAWNGIVGQVKKGRQAYVVCPLIDDSEAEGMADVKSVEETAAELRALEAKEPLLKVGHISGRMKSEQIEEVLARFTAGEINVLVSTTIIEVGVNVPNASLIVIRNAERFGLAQLHQLRGRVGRGVHESYCILVSEKKEQRKLEVMTQTTDGFVIAREDIALRGAGDFIGTEQSGQNRYVELILENKDGIYDKVREEVQAIFDSPKRLHYYRTQQVLGFEEVS